MGRFLVSNVDECVNAAFHSGFSNFEKIVMLWFWSRNIDHLCKLIVIFELTQSANFLLSLIILTCCHSADIFWSSFFKAVENKLL